MKTDKELADHLDAQDRLRNRWYTKEPCKTCGGIGYFKHMAKCHTCDGRGFKWRSPMMR